MTHKKYLAEASKGLIQELNEFLKTKGISNQEKPFIIKKLQVELDDNAPNKIVNSKHRNCLKWDSRWVERTDPTTKKKYWQLEKYCVQFEGD